MDPEFALRMIPQLVICGVGSVDDPDATLVYDETMAILDDDTYTSIRHDICVARLPPIDTLLNALLRGAVVALQLSHREGFEVKVTEALKKGIPVIAYRAGGIPLQIQHGHGGFLVDVGGTGQVAEYLFQLLTDDHLHRRMSDEATKNVTEEYWNVFQVLNWLSLFRELSEQSCHVESWCHPEEGKYRWVKHLWQEKMQDGYGCDGR